MEQSPDLVYPYKQDKKSQKLGAQSNGIMEQSPDLVYPYKQDKNQNDQGGQK